MTDALSCVYISLGANLGDRLKTLREAVHELSELGPLRWSHVYETAPVEMLEQPNYLNAVVELYTHLMPLELLSQLQAVELGHGRTRLIRFGPRTLDLDILLYNNEYICYQQLQVPHPRMWQRRFVLVPLSEFIPARRGLGGRTISELAHERAQEGDVIRVGPLFS